MDDRQDDRPICLTGASGFLAKHILLKLLAAGYRVRASLRDPARAAEVRAAVMPHLRPEAERRLSFVALDLLRDRGWHSAMQDCQALVHTASPFPVHEPKDPDDLIRPAVEGTVRALHAARAEGVGRVIMTSSTMAVLGAPLPPGRDHYVDADWSDLALPRTNAFAKSKTLAEHAAWDMVRSEGAGMGLTVINAGWMLGPPLDRRHGRSVGLVARLLAGRDLMLPRLGIPVVDVRDVAEMHLRALERPTTAGQRFLAVADTMWLTDWGRILSAAYPGRGIATRTAPDFLVWVMARFDPVARAVLPQLGAFPHVSCARAEAALGMRFRDGRAALLTAADYLVSHHLV